ncbi:unnamed protein product [Caenorhabditis brenneri]
MTTSPNKTFLLLTVSALMIFLAPVHCNSIARQQKGCYRKLELWAASTCGVPCAPLFKAFLNIACEQQQSQEQILAVCCPEQFVPMNKMYF